ncbi:MAG: C-5 cytosine-specific DNA methylase [Geminocystis sp. GBBB08]|nr:C-5 cytosine-specific DNA methylase [Geminocystis sp. GBBB08]
MKDIKLNKRQRGQQKIPPSGHLAPTIEFKNGKVYPAVMGVDLQERLARKSERPEDYPHWFTWFYQWADKDPITDLWTKHSIRVPSYLIHSVGHMISTDKSVSEILLFIRKNKNSSRSQNKI